MSERVAIVGSRTFPDLAAVRRYVGILPADWLVISGGAPGPDTVAVEAARARGLRVEEIAADWLQHGNAAGMIRNAELVKRATLVVAFYDGRSPGTRNTIERALRAGVRVIVHYYTAAGPIVHTTKPDDRYAGGLSLPLPPVPPGVPYKNVTAARARRKDPK